MKNFLQRSILIALLFVSYFANAQTSGTATGKVLNGKDKSPVDYASIAIKRLSDSSTVGGTNTSATGTFTINGLALGKYKLYVAYLGFKTITKDFELTAANPGINFGNLNMEDTGVTLNAVEIKGETPPVVVKKDTLEFNASTLKVKENAVVEDLLKKVPGVEVAKDGTITTQGETIKKVRVDGKDFMGSDPLMATRNLAADMVDKIQIIDDMSEQSKFSGVDDGNREKIINITTKGGVKNKGFVGNNTVGYGTDDRYDVNLSVSRFNQSEQMSLIGQFNNVNKQNFGGGIGGGGGMRFGGFNGGPQKGITTTNMGGFNYANVYKNGTIFNASYNLNKTSLFLDQNSLTKNLLGSIITTNSSDAVSTTERLNHRFNATLDTKIDSSISVRWQPSFTYSKNNGNSLNNYTREYTNSTTIGNQTNLTNSTSPSLSNSVLFRKKFQRRGRTLSLNINTNYNNSDGNTFNKVSENSLNGGAPSSKNTDRLNDQDSKSISNTARLVYTEPLSKTLNLELNYQNVYSFDNQERQVYDFNAITGQYDLINARYSNNFENTAYTNALGFSFNKNEKKYNWQIGLAVQNIDQKRFNVTENDTYDRNFVNLTPSAQFRYNFSNSKRLRISYNGRTSQPSISQIAPILDETNTQTLPIGNPDLKPSFTNSLNIFYNNFDFASYRSMFFGAFINQQFNAFSTQSTLIQNDVINPENNGKIQQKSVNVDGNFSANVFGSISQPIIKGNKLNLQIDLRGGYSKTTGFSGNVENITNSYSITNGYKLVSNLDKLDLIAGISGTMYRDKYSANSNNNTKYYTLSPNIDISYLLPGSIRIQSDLTYNKLTGRAGYNTDYTLINAYVSHLFTKSRITLKASVNDLLNQNTGIERNGGANTIQDLNYNVLKRYYMFSVTYSLSKIAGLNGNSGQQGGQRMRMGGM
ncbi:outer membrane beta-barrel family protein [Pedobacter boryungensis]|uniref:TonB-dependent receptor n=1 Tax=Pedobacter boryungensis TaxID=869962 RepID=A0ABX2DFY5_9SPHI|nr:outer membrane beta-barrel family protein [Pedobacter boryungensis]NQX32692.1 TonB-dependent receptor [Pedobacter boryungensis]